MQYSLGIDSGSTTTKGVLYQSGKVLKYLISPTTADPKTVITDMWAQLSQNVHPKPYFTITGYGRNLIDFADKKVTEITCHGLGARWLRPTTMTIIDVGGQDSKAIQLDRDGSINDFLMNDKCSAGTGRFLEVISTTLGLSIQQLDEVTNGEPAYPISSMCTVFAESEVISLRSENVPTATILSGVLQSIAIRTANFVARLPVEADVLFTGGGSLSTEFRQRLSTLLHIPIFTHHYAQFAGAIGAAIVGARQIEQANKRG